jgi:hypothetical protein
MSGFGALKLGFDPDLRLLHRCRHGPGRLQFSITTTFGARISKTKPFSLSVADGTSKW